MLVVDIVQEADDIPDMEGFQELKNPEDTQFRRLVPACIASATRNHNFPNKGTNRNRPHRRNSTAPALHRLLCCNGAYRTICSTWIKQISSQPHCDKKPTTVTKIKIQ